MDLKGQGAAMSEIAAGFIQYRAACYGDPHNLSDVQHKEVRQAFFAGALVAVLACVSIPAAGGTDEEMEQRLRALLQEAETLARP